MIDLPPNLRAIFSCCPVVEFYPRRIATDGFAFVLTGLKKNRTADALNKERFPILPFAARLQFDIGKAGRNNCVDEQPAVQRSLFVFKSGGDIGPRDSVFPRKNATANPCLHLNDRFAMGGAAPAGNVEVANLFSTSHKAGRTRNRIFQ